MVVAVNLHQADFSKLALIDDGVTSFNQMRGTAPLRANLDDPLVFAGCCQHRLAFDDVHADWLLNVDVHSRFDRGNHRQSVPVVWSGDENDIEVLFLQQSAIVTVDAWPLL